MNTRSIKTAIIILLAAVNIFLIYNIAALDMRVQNIPADMIENASAILKGRGIDADMKLIPARKPVNYIYEGVFPEYSEIVKNFSGASDEEIRNGHYVTLDEIAIFNAGEYTFDFEDNMQIKIVKSDYAGGVTVGELADYADFNRNDMSGAESIIRDFLRKYPAQDIRTGFDILEFKKDGGRDIVRINQTADGLYIASHTAYIIIEDGEVKYFSGRWYFGKLSGGPDGNGYRMPLLDAVNILFKSLEHDGDSLNGAKLENMGKEYNILEQHGMDTFYFTPSWVVSFDGGRNFSYDMIMGNKNN